MVDFRQKFANEFNAILLCMGLFSRVLSNEGRS